MYSANNIGALSEGGAAVHTTGNEANEVELTKIWMINNLNHNFP